MKEEEIEFQIWQYIDGTCTGTEHDRIAALIVTHAAWKRKHKELAALNESLSETFEAEVPSMRFSKNVMDRIATTPLARPSKKYINLGVIRSITVLFAAAFALILVCVIVAAKQNSPATSSFSRLNAVRFDLAALLNSPMFNLLIALNIVLALVFLDAVIRRRFTGH